MRILNRDEMRRAEDEAAEKGTSHAQLMENAGILSAEEIVQLVKNEGRTPGRLEEKSILMLCGKGNNAGDAFVAARLLSRQGWQVEWVPLAGEEYSPLAEMNLEKLPEGVEKKTIERADFETAVIVDAVFGTGFRGALPPEIQQAFERANRAPALRVALDLPSGLDCDTGEASPGSFEADLTLTFGAYKPGLLAGQGTALCGEIRCLDIGL